MKHVLRVALIITGIGAIGSIGCRSSSGTGSGPGEIERPKGVDQYVEAIRVYQSGDRERAIAQLIEATPGAKARRLIGRTRRGGARCGGRG